MRQGLTLGRQEESELLERGGSMIHPCLTARRGNLVKQLTVRGVGKDLERCLRDVAKARGVSLNRAALILLRAGAGLGAPRHRANVVGDSLDDLIGSWSKAEESEFLQTIGRLEEIDPSLWRRESFDAHFGVID